MHHTNFSPLHTAMNRHLLTQIAISHLHRCIFNETKYAAILHCLSLSGGGKGFQETLYLFGTVISSPRSSTQWPNKFCSFATESQNANVPIGLNLLLWMRNATSLYNQYIQTAILCLGTQAVCGCFIKGIFFLLQVVWGKLCANYCFLSAHYMYVMNIFANVILKFESRSSLSSNPNKLSHLGLGIFKVKLARVFIRYSC